MARLSVPYLQWRAQPDGTGRPRWEPGPALRARGFKGRDLKAADGSWLSFGDAVDAARALNAVAAQGAAGGTGTQALVPAGVRERSVSHLFARFKARPRFAGLAAPAEGEPSRRTVKILAPRTREAYAYHMRLIEAHCGDVAVAYLSPEAAEDFYGALIEDKGVATANAVMRTWRATFYYAVKLRWIASNPLARPELMELDGRCVVWTPAEIMAAVAAADELGFPCIGDAIVLAVMSALRRHDVLTVPEGDLRGRTYTLKTAKTGTLIQIPVVARLLARIRIARRRKRKLWPNVAFMTEIVAFDTGKAYGATQFSNRFDAVRANAAFAVPGITSKRFADLRDTAITWMARAGLTKFEIAAITGHSLKTIETVLEKHYLVLDASLARAGGVKLNAFLKAEGMG